MTNKNKSSILMINKLENRGIFMKLNNKGQALVEYLLIIAVISVIAVSVVKILGGYLQDSITKSSCNLVDKVYVEGDKPGEGTCQ